MATALFVSRLLVATQFTVKRSSLFSQSQRTFVLVNAFNSNNASQVCNLKHFYSSDPSTSYAQKYVSSQNNEIKRILSEHMMIYSDFITEEEEKSLLDEAEKHMKRLRYQFDHWDNAIHGYREIEKKNWSSSNQNILERVKELAFVKDVTPLAHVHVLDIAKDGYIKPHVDAVRFCGDTITGLCLLSPCVMRLALETDSSKFGDILLPRKCLYVMRGRARYEFTHEVLKDEESYFNDEHVPRDRRISVICRNEPRYEDTL